MGPGAHGGAAGGIDPPAADQGARAPLSPRRTPHTRRERPGERMDDMRKKAYTAPTLVRHGSAVEVTLGWGGKFLEFINWRSA